MQLNLLVVGRRQVLLATEDGAATSELSDVGGGWLEWAARRT